MLKVVCVYLREDRALETRDETLVPLRTGPPEPVTKPVTEPLTEPVTEPVTEPTEPTEPEPPFTAPTLAIVSAALNGTDVTPLTYSYKVALNSAESLRVTAAITDQSGASLGSGGPWTHNASGTSPDRSSALSWTARPSSVTLTLTGTYTEKGETKTLTATQTLTAPEKPFEPPTLVIESAKTLPAELVLLYSYTVDLKDAADLTVSADFADTVSQLYLEETDTFVTLTLTCTYEQNGTAGSFTQTISAPISMKANYFGFSCEYYSETPGELLLWLYADYEARNNDPHKTDYDFEIAAFTLDWYNAAGAGLGTVDLTSAASAVLTVEYDDEYANYSLSCDLSTAIPENAALLRFSLTLRDKTTGKTYSDVSELMDLN